MTEITPTDIQAQLQEPWLQFVRLTAEHRPALFAFGLKLTGSPFDGEDLVHEAMIRGFGAAAVHDGSVTNLRSYLFRTMANIWIDQQRRPDIEPMAELPDRGRTDPDRAELREASATLFEQLPPRERVAVVLHDAFGFRHSEIAAMLTTSEGAVRSALHRAKQRLADPLPRPRIIDVGVVDRFVAAFAAADLPTIRALLLDDVSADVFPYAGTGAAEAMGERGWVTMGLAHHDEDLLSSGEAYPTRIERIEIAGCQVLAVDRDGPEGMVLEEVWVLETVDDKVAAIHDYCFSPQVIEHIGQLRGVPIRLMGYQFPG